MWFVVGCDLENLLDRPWPTAAPNTKLTKKITGMNFQ